MKDIPDGPGKIKRAKENGVLAENLAGQVIPCFGCRRHSELVTWQFAGQSRNDRPQQVDLADTDGVQPNTGRIGLATGDTPRQLGPPSSAVLFLDDGAIQEPGKKRDQ